MDRNSTTTTKGVIAHVDLEADDSESEHVSAKSTSNQPRTEFWSQMQSGTCVNVIKQKLSKLQTSHQGNRTHGAVASTSEHECEDVTVTMQNLHQQSHQHSTPQPPTTASASAEPEQSCPTDNGPSDSQCAIHDDHTKTTLPTLTSTDQLEANHMHEVCSPTSPAEDTSESQAITTRPAEPADSDVTAQAPALTQHEDAARPQPQQKPADSPHSPTTPGVDSPNTINVTKTETATADSATADSATADSHHKATDAHHRTADITTAQANADGPSTGQAHKCNNRQTYTPDSDDDRAYDDRACDYYSDTDSGSCQWVTWSPKYATWQPTQQQYYTQPYWQYAQVPPQPAAYYYLPTMCQQQTPNQHSSYRSSSHSHHPGRTEPQVKRQRGEAKQLFNPTEGIMVYNIVNEMYEELVLVKNQRQLHGVQGLKRLDNILKFKSKGLPKAIYEKIYAKCGSYCGPCIPFVQTQDLLKWCSESVMAGVISELIHTMVPTKDEWVKDENTSMAMLAFKAVLDNGQRLALVGRICIRVVPALNSEVSNANTGWNRQMPSTPSWFR
jgi:hypothetical protein